jgi:hypothetical protein
MPAFDYLIIKKISVQPRVRYVVKDALIDYVTYPDDWKTFGDMYKTLTTYFENNEINKNKVVYYQINSDSISIKRKSNQPLGELSFPIRTYGSQQLLKIPFSQIDVDFQSQVEDFVNEINDYVTGA